MALMSEIYVEKYIKASPVYVFRSEMNKNFSVVFKMFLNRSYVQNCIKIRLKVWELNHFADQKSVAAVFLIVLQIFLYLSSSTLPVTRT